MFGLAWLSLVLCVFYICLVWYGMVWCGVVWFGLIRLAGLSVCCLRDWLVWLLGLVWFAVVWLFGAFVLV